jgi:hypothetical protein
MKRLLLCLSVAALLSESLAADYVSSSASGTTNATVDFPGKTGRTLRLLSADVTSDKAASLLSWRAADGYSATVLEPAANNVTNVLTSDTSIASNDVVLIQLAAGTLLEKTVYENTKATNMTIAIGTALSTNLAIGDLVYEVTATQTTTSTADEGAEQVYVTSTNGFAADAYVYISGEVRQFLAPAGRPARLSLDGTSAVKVNYASGVYE